MNCGAFTADAEEEKKEDRCMSARKGVQTRRPKHDPGETGGGQAPWVVQRKQWWEYSLKRESTLSCSNSMFRWLLYRLKTKQNTRVYVAKSRRPIP